MQRRREIAKLGGTTLCMCTHVFAFVSANSTGLRADNYSSPEGALYSKRKTSNIQNMFLFYNTAGSCLPCMQTTWLWDPSNKSAFLPNMIVSATTKNVSEIISKYAFGIGCALRMKSLSMELFWPISDLPVVFIGQCFYIPLWSLYAKGYFQTHYKKLFISFCKMIFIH